MCTSSSPAPKPAPATPGLPGPLKVNPDPSQAAAFKGAAPKPNTTGRIGGELMIGTDASGKQLLGN